MLPLGRPKITSTRYTPGMPRRAKGEHPPLEPELQLLYQAIAASSNGITISDPGQPDNPLIYVNRSFELMTGYSREEGPREHRRGERAGGAPRRACALRE